MQICRLITHRSFKCDWDSMGILFLDPSNKMRHKNIGNIAHPLKLIVNNYLQFVYLIEDNNVYLIPC